jgi:hypothetical protein
MVKIRCLATEGFLVEDILIAYRCAGSVPAIRGGTNERFNS